MFEADWTPSSWDDQEDQRRHLAAGDKKTVPPKATQGAKKTVVADPKAAPPGAKAAAPPAAVVAPTTTDRQAALIAEYPACKVSLTHRNCPEFIKNYKECELSKAKKDPKTKKVSECWNGSYYNEHVIIKSA